MFLQLLITQGGRAALAAPLQFVNRWAEHATELNRGNALPASNGLADETQQVADSTETSLPSEEHVESVEGSEASSELRSPEELPRHPASHQLFADKVELHLDVPAYSAKVVCEVIDPEGTIHSADVSIERGLFGFLLSQTGGTAIALYPHGFEGAEAISGIYHVKWKVESSIRLPLMLPTVIPDAFKWEP
jgi:hypothetical protein